MKGILAAAALTLAAHGLSAAEPRPFLFQLQNPNPTAIRATGFEVVVVDYSRDGSDDRAFLRAQVESLRASGKTVLAYFSIGEAENYRFYWKAAWVKKAGTNQFTAAAPAWLGRTNPDWLGNYKVRYWDDGWRSQALEPYLRRITQAGFDGVYLDIIDAYDYWSDTASYGTGREKFRAGDPKGQRAVAARRMIDLVAWIASYGRLHSPRKEAFKVVPQNAEDIVGYDSGGTLRKAVTGWGVEDLWYDETSPVSAGETAYRLKYLRKLAAAGKQILSVDYVDDGSGYTGANKARIDAYRALAGAEGFFAYAARSDRELDRINTIPGVQP